MEGASIQVRVGGVESFCGRLGVSLVAYESGNGHIQIYCDDPSDRRKAGVLLCLDEHRFEQLKQLIDKTDQAVSRLSEAGQLRRLTASFG